MVTKLIWEAALKAVFIPFLRFSASYLHVGQLIDRWKKWPLWRLRQINRTTILWGSGQENSITHKHTNTLLYMREKDSSGRKIQVGDIIGPSELQGLKTDITNFWLVINDDHFWWFFYADSQSQQRWTRSRSEKQTMLSQSWCLSAFICRVCCIVGYVLTQVKEVPSLYKRPSKH